MADALGAAAKARRQNTPRKETGNAPAPDQVETRSGHLVVRAAAIADIHASTLLLNEIARDLAGEVAAQQDHVDALEDNNARANAAITQGHAKLKEAQEHQHAGCVVC